MPGGALSASAWLRLRLRLRLRCVAGRPGRGHVEGLALLAGRVEGLPPGAGGRCSAASSGPQGG